MLEKSLQAKVKKHLDMCAICLEGDTMLCEGMVPVLVPSKPFSVIRHEECSKVKKGSNLESQMRSSFVPPAVISRICGRDDYTKATISEDGVIKMGRKSMPALSYVPSSCDMSKQMTMYKILAGLLVKKHTCAVIVPHVVTQVSDEVFDQVMNKIEEADFVILLQPEVAVPRSGVYLQVMESIYLRMQDGLPTCVMPGDWDEFQRAATNSKHVVNGTLSYMLNACKAVEL